MEIPNHDYPDPGDALDQRGNSTHCGGDCRSKSPPTLQGSGTIPTNCGGTDKAETTHPLGRPLVVDFTRGDASYIVDDERAWNGNRKSLGSARIEVDTKKAKRVKVDSSTTPTTQSEPITNKFPNSAI